MLALTLLLVPAVALNLLGTLRSARGYYQEVTQRQNADVATNLVNQNDLMVGQDVDRGRLAEVARTLAMTNPGVEIYVLDDGGRVLAASVPSTALARTSVDLRPVTAFVAGQRSFPLLGTDPRRETRTVFSAAALAGGGGYLYVILTDEMQANIVRGVQSSTALRASIIGSLTILTLVLSGGALAFGLLTRRLRRLTAAMVEFRPDAGRAAAGSPRTARPRDEIDELSDVFLALRQRIGQQVDALERADVMRRELVTNVSHDLRTPLAALRGALETLELKGDSLPAEERAAFLASAQAQGRRLGRLIDQLFELSVLDDASQVVALEDFPLQELLADLIQKERVQAEAAGLRLTFDAPPTLPFVRGNIGLLERSVLNLLENALRHTPAGGEVRVTLARSAPKRVRVTVADDGEGIAPEHQARVFERFYQVPGSDRGHAGAGLGLAITQRILALHGSAVSLAGGPGEGCCFYFDLPIAGEDVTPA